MRCRFERWLVDALDVQVTPLPGLPSDAVEAVTVIAQRDNDGVFDWLADGADSRQMVCFLMVEGGPDVGMPSAGLPLTALFRSALRGLLATNRNLRPEQLGALGVGHLQAGPRRRRVLTGLKRLGAPTDALPLFTESAYADAHHGEEWIDRVLRPVADDRPEWGQRIVRGALWHSSVNARLFRDLHELIATRDLQTA
jgi:hypothetical protein